MTEAVWVRLKTSAWHLYKCEAFSRWDRERTVVWTECLKTLGVSDRTQTADYAYIETKPRSNWCNDCMDFYEGVIEAGSRKP